MAGQGPDDHLRVPRPGGSGKVETRWPFRDPVCAIGCIPPLPVRPHGQIRQHPRDRRQHPGRQGRQARAGRHRPLRQDRSVQPARVRQGPPRARRHRGRRATGDLKPGQTVIEATSGNTGIGLAMVCAQKGYPLVVTMAESFSVERRKLMRFLGAKVILTPAPAGGTGMVNKAVELAKTHGWFLTRQFENEANADFHSRTTAREIVNDFAGERLDYWVTGFGTGGTLKGVARVLAKERPETRIVSGEPADAPMLSQRHAAGAERRRLAGVAATRPGSRIRFRAGARTSSPSSPATRSRRSRSTGCSPCPTPEAMQWSRQLARQGRIFVGISAGGTFAAAWRSPRTRRRARRCSACCPTPASAISPPRSSPRSRST